MAFYTRLITFNHFEYAVTTWNHMEVWILVRLSRRRSRVRVSSAPPAPPEGLREIDLLQSLFLWVKLLLPTLFPTVNEFLCINLFLKHCLFPNNKLSVIIAYKIERGEKLEIFRPPSPFLGNSYGFIDSPQCTKAFSAVNFQGWLSGLFRLWRTKVVRSRLPVDILSQILYYKTNDVGKKSWMW